MVFEECEAATGDLIAALEELDSRLSVGIVIADYRIQVQNVCIEYDQAVDSILDADPRCIRAVGVPLEKALNAHVKALNRWSACIENFGCDIDSIDPELQRSWRKASRALAKAHSGLDRLQPV